MTDLSSHWCCKMLTCFKLSFCLYLTKDWAYDLHNDTKAVTTDTHQPLCDLVKSQVWSFHAGQFRKGNDSWLVTYSHVILYFQLLWKVSTFLKSLFWSVIVLKCSRHFNRKRHIMGILNKLKQQLYWNMPCGHKSTNENICTVFSCRK